MIWATFNQSLIGSETIPEKEQWLLLDDLYRVSAVGVAAAVIVIASIIGMVRSPSIVFSLWAGSAIMLFCARVALSMQYTQRHADARTQRWTLYFTIASVLTGLQWGAGAAAFYIEVDGASRMGVFAVECALIAGASVRSYAAPHAAISQVSLACLGFIVVFVYRQEWLMTGIFAIYLCFNVSTIRRLGKAQLERIQAECGRRELFRMLASSNEQLNAMNLRLEQMAFTDSLTGLANRRGFDAFLSDAYKHGELLKREVTLLIADVDHFKRFNDEYGHPTGDACLVLVANAIKTSLRHSTDFAARYGGEEFVIILPDTCVSDALCVADRIREAVAAIKVFIPEGDSARVSISLGGASTALVNGANIETLLSRADEALYKAKFDGRNCVRFARLANANEQIQRA